MRRVKGESDLRHLLDEMASTLGVTGATDKDRIRGVAEALGVPTPERDPWLAVLELYHTYLGRGNDR
jgi:hypothetical protein